VNVHQSSSADARGISEQKPGASRGLVLLLIAMTALGPLSLNILVPAVPGLVSVLATDAGSVQLTISLYLLGLAGAQLVLGPLSDRFGRRPVVLAGLALALISSLAAIAASSIGSLIVARVGQALGASTGLVIGRAIIRDLVDRERTASMIGLVSTVMAVAPMVAPLIGGILDTAFGWESIFIFIAAASAIVLGWAIPVLPETRPARIREASHFWPDLRALVGTPSFIGYVLSGAFASAAFYTFLGGAPHVVVTMMGRTSAEYGIWFVVNSIGYIAGAFITSRRVSRYGVDRMIRWGLLLQFVVGVAAVVLGDVLFWLGPAVIFIPQTLISFGNGIVISNAVAAAVSVRPEIAGTASGIAGFVQMALGAAVAQFAGWVVAGASTALPMTLTTVAVSTAGVAAFALLVRR
jgi:DHA1 family bicyclomycin/chloramphenicol resistance-like MFS transporter